MADANADQDPKKDSGSEDPKNNDNNPTPDYPVDEKGMVTVPADVLSSYKNDMHKYKNQRNEERDKNQDLTKKVTDYEAADKKTKNEKLLQDGEFKEVIKNKDDEIESLNKQLKNQTMEFAIKSEAMKQGANNIDDVTKLFDTSKITLNDNGQIEGLSEAMKEFKESKSYLFGTNGDGDDPKIEVDTGKASTIKIEAQKKYEDYLPSELMKIKKQNPDYYKKLEADFDKRTGTVSPGPTTSS
jgi:hypothetical protein